MSDREEALRRIAEARATSEPVLDLGDLALDSLPQELANLPALRVLAVSKWVPRQEDGGLQWTYEGNRPEQRFAELDALAGLAGLEVLELSYCDGITELNGLAGLERLQTLELSCCYGITELNALASLARLQTLNLSCCSGLTELNALAGLEGLQTLNLSCCDGITELNGLAGLAGLQTLHLSYCKGITEVKGLAGLAGLQTLYLNGCKGITEFAPLRKLLPQLKHLSLCQCRFKDLDPAVCGELGVENVLGAVRAHYAEGDAHGWHADEELKVFVLGNGSVGKTQLCRRLRNLPFDSNEKLTHGVQLEHIDIALAGRDGLVRLNLWDFGGQDIYHGSHTLFLQASAVFVLLWTPNTEDGEYEEMGGVKIRHRSLAYWLDYVQRVAEPGSPIIIVQGRCDSDQDQRPLPVPLPKDSSFVRCMVFSAKEDKEEAKLEAVRTALAEAAGVVLDRHKAPNIPEGRFRLGRQLRQMLEDDQKRPAAERRRLLTLKDFRRLCKENSQIDYWREALRFLHFRGVIFWQPKLFKGDIILDQSWALDAIYAVFHRAKTLPTLFGKGRFTRELLKELVWQDRTEGEQRTFLGLMESCGICFCVRCLNPGNYPEEWEYLAPELLPKRTSPEIQHQLISPIPDDAVPARAKVRYSFLHEGILRRFLSWLGSNIGDKAVYWRFGCWFYDPHNGVQVIIDSSWDNDRQHPGQGFVTLEAWGEKSVALLLLETLIAQLNSLSPIQEPEVDRMGFEELAFVSKERNGEVAPDAILTLQRIGIGLGRTSMPTPGRSVKGAAVTRWKGLYVLVKILLNLKTGDPVTQRNLCKSLMDQSNEVYSPNTVGNYMRSLEEYAKRELFHWPDKDRKGHPTILLPGVTDGLNEAKQYIENQLNIILPNWRQFRWAM